MGKKNKSLLFSLWYPIAHWVLEINNNFYLYFPYHSQLYNFLDLPSVNIFFQSTSFNWTILNIGPFPHCKTVVILLLVSVLFPVFLHWFRQILLEKWKHKVCTNFTAKQTPPLEAVFWCRILMILEIIRAFFRKQI